ncbi:MAG TPA: YraN family protein [Gammaproteobacteria bacterium]|nr:YraN family protein [Gammaproteobacteria bacterium]
MKRRRGGGDGGREPGPESGGSTRRAEGRRVRAAGRATGRVWEDAASEYLARRGVPTLLRGYQCRFGELDLVCADGDYLVVVEVRARSSSRFASAKSSVDVFKQRKIVLATRHLLMRRPEWHDRSLRFDVVAIEGIESEAPEIEWIRNAFDAA